MTKFFKVPFESEETVILGHIAIIEAEDAEDAYHILEDVIGNGENPYASNLSCKMTDVIDVIDTKGYNSNPDGLDIDDVISNITEIKDMESFLNKTLTDYQKADAVSKNLTVIQLSLKDIDKEVIKILDGNADFVNTDSNSWIYNKTTIDQLADIEYFDENEIPTKGVFEGMQSLKNLLEYKNAVSLCLIQ